MSVDGLKIRGMVSTSGNTGTNTQQNLTGTQDTITGSKSPLSVSPIETKMHVFAQTRCCFCFVSVVVVVVCVCVCFFFFLFFLFFLFFFFLCQFWGLLLL